MQLFSLPFLFSNSKESEQNDDSSNSSCSSDESDSRFMNEHETSFVPLHPHQRVEQFHQVMAPVDDARSPLPLHVQSKEFDDVSLLSFECESSALSGNSSVELNPYGSNSTPSNLDVSMRWRRNMNLVKKEQEDNYMHNLSASAPEKKLQQNQSEKINKYLRFQDKLEHFEDATVASKDSTRGYVEKGKRSNINSEVLAKTLRSASAYSAAGSPIRLMGNKSNSSPPVARKDVYLNWANKVYTQRNEGTKELSPLQPPEPPKIKKKYSGSQFQISPPSTMRKSTSDYPLSEANGRFSTKTSPSRNAKKASIRVGLGSEREESASQPLSRVVEDQNSAELTRRQASTSCPQSANRIAITPTNKSAFSSTPPKANNENFPGPFASEASPHVYSTPKVKTANVSSQPSCGLSETNIHLSPVKFSCHRSVSYAFSSSSSESGSDFDSSDDSITNKSDLNPVRCTPSNPTKCSLTNSPSGTCRSPPFLKRLTGIKEMGAMDVENYSMESTESPAKMIFAADSDFSGKCTSRPSNYNEEAEGKCQVEANSNESPVQKIRRSLNVNGKCTPSPNNQKKEASVKMVKLVDAHNIPDVSTTPKSMTEFERRTKEWMNRMWSPDKEEWDYVGDVITVVSPFRKTSNLDTTQPMTDDDDDNLCDVSETDVSDKNPPGQDRTLPTRSTQDSASLEHSHSRNGNPTSIHLGSPLLEKRRSRICGTKSSSPICLASEYSDNSLAYSMSSVSGAPIAFCKTKRSSPLNLKSMNTSENASVGMSDFETKRRNISEAAAMNCRLLADYEKTNCLKKQDQNSNIEGFQCIVVKPHSAPAGNFRKVPVATLAESRKKKIPGEQFRHIVAIKIQSNYRGMQGRQKIMKMLGVEKRKRWQPRGKSPAVTKIHSNIRRAARKQLRERYVLGDTQRSTASMAVAVRRVCALIIQAWWKKHLQHLNARRANGFDSFNIPSSWNKTSKSDCPFFAVEEKDSAFLEETDNHQQVIRPNRSKSGDSQTSGTDFSSQSEKFDQGYYNRSHANLYEENVDESKRFIDDENVEASISLLAKIQNGIRGRFVKFFKKRSRGKTKKNTNKQRLRKMFKKKKKNGPEPQQKITMLGDPEANAELPDPLSLYRPLKEDDKNNVEIQHDTQSDCSEEEVIPREHAAQLIISDTDSIASFSLLAGSFASTEDIFTGCAEPKLEDDDYSSEDEEPMSRFTYSDVALVRALTMDSVPFDEI